MSQRRSSGPDAARDREPGDLLDVLGHQHAGIEEIFTLLGEPMAAEERRLLTAGVITELLQHAADERQYLHPALRHALAKGDALTEAGTVDHQRVEALLLELQQLDPDSDEFACVLAQTMAQVRRHVTDVESDSFPRLRRACSCAMLASLGGKVRGSRATAWTELNPPLPGLVQRVRQRLRNQEHDSHQARGW